MKRAKYYLLLIIFIGHCLPCFSQSSKDVSELVDSVMYNDSLAAYYGGKGNLSKAREYASRNVAINSLFGNKTVPYAISVLKLSKYIPLNEEVEYKSLAEEGLAILKDSLGIQSPIYTKYLLGYAWRNYNSTQIQEACKIIKDVAEGGFVSDEPLLGHLYYSYAHFLFDNGEIEKAREYAKKAEAFYDNHKLWSEDYYALTLIDLAFLSVPTSNDRFNYLNKARNNIEQYKGKESIDYLNVTLDISYAYRSINQLDKALEYAQLAKGIGENIKSMDYSSYLYTLEYLSNVYSNMKLYNEAITNAEECLTLMKESKEIAIEERLPTLDSLIVYNWNISNVEKANLYAKEAYLIRKSLNIYGDEMVRNLFYLIHSNYYFKKYEECVKNVKAIQDIYGDLYSSSYKHYFDDMEVLRNSYFKMKMYNETLEVSNEMLMNHKKYFGEDDDYYANLLLFHTTLYTHIGDYDKYHEYSLKVLEIYKRLYGELSPNYLNTLTIIAVGFNKHGLEDAYSLSKESAELTFKIYGKQNMLFVINYLNAMVLWINYKGDYLDEYRLDDLYMFLHFYNVICNFNHGEEKQWDKIRSKIETKILTALPSILQKYKNDPQSIDAVYNSLLLLRSKQANISEISDIKTQIKNELNGDSENELDAFCITNSNYLETVIEDSLYNESIKYMSEISQKSPTFKEFANNNITTNVLKSNLKEYEVVIDYLCLKQSRNVYTDYFVVIDKSKVYPDFVPVENASEQIKQICSSYKTSYFLIDNDSIISNLNIDVTKTNCIIGHDLSIEHIINRSQKNQNKAMVPVGQKEDHQNAFTYAYDEFEKGVKLYKKKEYEEAVKYFYLSDSLMYVAKGEKSNYFGHGMHWISSCYHKLGLDSIAKRYSQYYYLQPVDMRQTIVSDSILDVAERLYNDGNKREALEKYDEASKIEKTNVGKNYWYANTISHCAEICNELEKYERAVSYEKEALEIRKKSPGNNHVDYYWSLKNLYHSYQSIESISDFIYYGGMLTEFMETHWDLLGSEQLLYPIYTSTMARVLYDKGELSAVYSYLQKAISSSELLLDYPFAYMNLHFKAIMGFELIEKDSLSFELCKKIIPYYEKHQEEQINPDEFFQILLFAANHYYNKGDYITASIYQERSLNKVKDNNNLLYGTALSNLALTYSHLSRLDESIELAQKALMLCDSTQNIDEYTKRLINLAHCYSVNGDFKKALRCGKEAYELLNEKFGKDYYQTILAANNLSHYYNELGYEREKLQMLNMVIDECRKDISKCGDILACALNDMSIYISKESPDLALRYADESYEIRKKLFGEQNPYTSQSLYNKGIILLDMGRLVDAVDCIIESLKTTEKNHGRKSLSYVTQSKILPKIYGIDHKEKAISIQEEIVVNLRDLTSDNHPEYLHALEGLSELYFFTGNDSPLSKILEKISRGYKQIVISDFPNYTATERAKLIDGMGRFFDWLFPLICYYKPQSDTCSELYNALMIRKGILLNSEIEFKRLIRDSGDSSLVRQYNELISDKNLLNRQYQLPVEQRVFDVDSLRYTINEKEDYLILASKEYGDYTKRFRTNWKDIRNKLKDGELSVEFVEFNDTCTIQNRIYYALVINKNSVSPELVPLCMEQQIHEVLKSDNPGGLYKLIWNPILQKSKNVNTLFFSPAGILNNLGIEYVDINEHDNISDKYAIYRLSSTREIIENQKTACKSAALYGGLDYSVDSDVLLAQNARSGIETNSSVMYRGLSDSLSVRNSFEPLYNTKTEIAEIDKTLRKGNVAVSMYSDTSGTEESFKALSGKGMNLIHLATHGMYIEASEAKSKKKETNLSFIQLDDNDFGQIQEDKSLSRSFLVMSGGDMLPSHKEIPDNLEDGILTALEISKQDLRGLDLVVLSACQTALGDVDNEGVYGLQRGFKKAGANTILMSLDKVDDEATKILMVEFYKNLMNGKSKYQSLKDAQKYLRQVDNGKYNKPEYWASFILLDGLN